MLKCCHTKVNGLQNSWQFPHRKNAGVVDNEFSRAFDVRPYMRDANADEDSTHYASEIMYDTESAMEMQYSILTDFALRHILPLDTESFASDDFLLIHSENAKLGVIHQIVPMHDLYFVTAYNGRKPKLETFYCTDPIKLLAMSDDLKEMEDELILLTNKCRDSIYEFVEEDLEEEDFLLMSYSPRSGVIAYKIVRYADTNFMIPPNPRANELTSLTVDGDPCPAMILRKSRDYLELKMVLQHIHSSVEHYSYGGYTVFQKFTVHHYMEYLYDARGLIRNKIDIIGDDIRVIQLGASLKLRKHENEKKVEEKYRRREERPQVEAPSLLSEEKHLETEIWEEKDLRAKEVYGKVCELIGLETGAEDIETQRKNKIAEMDRQTKLKACEKTYKNICEAEGEERMNEQQINRSGEVQKKLCEEMCLEEENICNLRLKEVKEDRIREEQIKDSAEESWKPSKENGFKRENICKAELKKEGKDDIKEQKINGSGKVQKKLFEEMCLKEENICNLKLRKENEEKIKEDQIKDSTEDSRKPSKENGFKRENICKAELKKQGKDEINEQQINGSGGVQKKLFEEMCLKEENICNLKLKKENEEKIKEEQIKDSTEDSRKPSKENGFKRENICKAELKKEGKEEIKEQKINGSGEVQKNLCEEMSLEGEITSVSNTKKKEKKRLNEEQRKEAAQVPRKLYGETSLVTEKISNFDSMKEGMKEEQIKYSAEVHINPCKETVQEKENLSEQLNFCEETILKRESTSDLSPEYVKRERMKVNQIKEEDTGLLRDLSEETRQATEKNTLELEPRKLDEETYLHMENICILKPQNEEKETMKEDEEIQEAVEALTLINEENITNSRSRKQKDNICIIS